MSRLSEEIYNIKLNQLKENNKMCNQQMTNKEFKEQMEELKQVDVNIQLMCEAVEYKAHELLVAAEDLNRQIIDLIKEIKKYE